MERLMSVTRFYNANGWIERTTLSVDKLLYMEEAISDFTKEDSGLQAAYKYWASKHQDFRTPENAFDPSIIGDERTVVSVADVSANVPFGYFFKQYRCAGENFMTQKRIIEYPLRELAEPTILDYLVAKDEGRPQGHHIRHDLNGFKRDYLRLLLPLASKNGKVSALACISHHFAPPVPGESLQATRDETNTTKEHPSRVP